MSTDSPLSTAPEMPSTSSAAIASAPSWQSLFAESNSNSRNEADSNSSPPSSNETPHNADHMGESAADTDNAPSSKDEDKKSEEKRDDSMFECNICLDPAKDAVVSMCGHLYCWPCLHQWLETRPSRKLCPVCKAAISKEKVIPLYGRNSTKQEDPRNKVPPRPAGQRTEPDQQQGFQGFGFLDGFQMSFGIGAFPFGFITLFNFGEQRPPVNRGTTQYEDEQQLSKLFLYLAFLCIAWLLFA